MPEHYSLAELRTALETWIAAIEAHQGLSLMAGKFLPATLKSPSRHRKYHANQ